MIFNAFSPFLPIQVAPVVDPSKTTLTVDSEGVEDRTEPVGVVAEEEVTPGELVEANPTPVGVGVVLSTPVPISLAKQESTLAKVMS